ncbi:hypothetical protein ABPG74_012683 [Tetrahymena malaccensis]
MNNVNQLLNKVIVGSKGNYKLTQQLGNGSISVVFKAERQEDNTIFAVKYVSSYTFEGQRKNKYQQNELEISRKIMEIKSKNLIEIFEVIQEDSDDCYIVMEYCDMCDLFSFSLTFWINWQTAIEFGYQIACGINDLHKFNITHRDLKPENIFVSSRKNDETQKIEYNIKIGDFGLSKEGDIFTSTVGTPNYMGPESYQEGDKTKETDIWAFGAILFELIEKKQYFSSHSAIVIYNQIKNFKIYDKQRLTKIDDSDVLERVNNLIQKCLNFQPQNRIQSAELVQEMQSLLLSAKYQPQEKRHISLKIPTNDFLKNQSYFQSIYYEIQDEDIHKSEEKHIVENKLNKQFIKKVESELVENSPDNSNENKNNYDSQNQIAESQKEQSCNSIFYDQSKQISITSSKQNRSQDLQNLGNVELVFSKLVSNNSNQNTEQEPNQSYLQNGHEKICDFFQGHNDENGQNGDYKYINQTQNTQEEDDNFQQNNLNCLNINRVANSIYPIQEVRNSTYQSNQSESAISSSYFIQSDTCQTLQQECNGNNQKFQFYQNTDFGEQNQNIDFDEQNQKKEQFNEMHLNQNDVSKDFKGSDLNTNFSQSGNQNLLINEKNEKEQFKADDNYLEFVELAIQILQIQHQNNSNNQGTYVDSYNLKDRNQIINQEEDLNIYVMYYLLRHSLGYKKNNFYQELKNKEIQSNKQFSLDNLFQFENETKDNLYIFQLENQLIRKFTILQYKEYKNLIDQINRYKYINKFSIEIQYDQKAKPQDYKKAKPQDDQILYMKKHSQQIQFILYDENMK